MIPLILIACTQSTPSTPTTPPTPPEPVTKPDPQARAAEVLARAKGVLAPLPDRPVAGDNDLSEARVALGRTLYFDTRLSKNHDLSCNSCHALDNWGVDGQPTSPGHKAQRGSRNSPTVYNASLHVAQFWDGRAATVEEQAGGPMVNPVEMAMKDGAQVTAVLRTIPGYEPMFQAAFPGVDQPISYENAATAIGAFERTLLTPAPIDHFLAGKLDALSAEQVEGLAAFLDAGCVACHSGAAIGGQGFFKLGQVQPYETKDAGRFDVTGKEEDRGVFKAPSLRNIEKTGPWLHDGSITSLPEVVRLMGKHQLGRELEPAQVESIVAFLGALTGDLPTDKIAAPELPPSGPKTPKPDPT